MLEQSQGRNRLWNKLVEIERAHREIVRGKLAVADDRVQQLADELAAVREEIKRQKRAARSGKVDATNLLGKWKRCA